jgi:m7GpppX diphosphatase
VRDLTGDHATPLKKLRDAVYTMLEAKFGCTADGLRVYMHYLPSFWMAHIHFAAITYPGGSSMSPVGKAILLDDVIDALERDPHHFQKANITYMVGERDPLHAKLVEAGALKPLLPLP